MLNSTISIKVKQRLNKLDSNDYDNLECWQIVEAFNKAQVEWVRRQLHGINIVKEGDEQSTRRIDDLQVLLTPLKLNPKKEDVYFFDIVPDNYLQWKRLDVYATKDCCDEPRRMKTYLVEEANINDLLADVSKKPSFEWAETFVTIENNRLNVYTNNAFDINKAELTYYRQPRRIEMKDCVDPYTNAITITDVESEFKDDIIELMIDEAVSVLAGDIESSNQFSRGTQTSERNN